MEQLEAVYRTHHEARRPKDFVFCGPERLVVFHEWVGTGGRVLDVGCRFGALTRAYLDGNEVVGVDIDRRALDEAASLGSSRSGRTPPSRSRSRTRGSTWSSSASCSSTCRSRN